MNVKEFLRNYRKISVQISIAEATQKLNATITKLKEEKRVVDIAIESLPAEQQMSIDCHYRQGMSFESIARRHGYSKSTIIKRVKSGVSIIETVLV